MLYLQASAVLNEALNETLHSGIAEGKGSSGERNRGTHHPPVSAHVSTVPGSTEVPAHPKSAREQCLRCWVLAAAVAVGAMLL